MSFFDKDKFQDPQQRRKGPQLFRPKIDRAPPAPASGELQNPGGMGGGMGPYRGQIMQDFAQRAANALHNLGLTEEIRAEFLARLQREMPIQPGQGVGRALGHLIAPGQNGSPAATPTSLPVGARPQPMRSPSSTTAPQLPMPSKAKPRGF